MQTDLTTPFARSLPNLSWFGLAWVGLACGLPLFQIPTPPVPLFPLSPVHSSLCFRPQLLFVGVCATCSRASPLPPISRPLSVSVVYNIDYLYGTACLPTLAPPRARTTP